MVTNYNKIIASVSFTLFITKIGTDMRFSKSLQLRNHKKKQNTTRRSLLTTNL